MKSINKKYIIGIISSLLIASSASIFSSVISYSRNKKSKNLVQKKFSLRDNLVKSTNNNNHQFINTLINNLQYVEEYVKNTVIVKEKNLKLSILGGWYSKAQKKDNVRKTKMSQLAWFNNYTGIGVNRYAKQVKATIDNSTHYLGIEQSKINNIISIIKNHPYTYSLYLNKQNLIIPNINFFLNNKSSNFYSKISNIRSNMYGINKSTDNLNNISENSEEATFGAKSINTSATSFTKALYKKITFQAKIITFNQKLNSYEYETPTSIHKVNFSNIVDPTRVNQNTITNTENINTNSFITKNLSHFNSNKSVLTEFSSILNNCLYTKISSNKYNNLLFSKKDTVSDIAVARVQYKNIMDINSSPFFYNLLIGIPSINIIFMGVSLFILRKLAITNSMYKKAYELAPITSEDDQLAIESIMDTGLRENFRILQKEIQWLDRAITQRTVAESMVRVNKQTTKITELCKESNLSKIYKNFVFSKLRSMQERAERYYETRYNEAPVGSGYTDLTLTSSTSLATSYAPSVHEDESSTSTSSDEEEIRPQVKQNNERKTNDSLTEDTDISSILQEYGFINHNDIQTYNEFTEEKEMFAKLANKTKEPTISSSSVNHVKIKYDYEHIKHQKELLLKQINALKGASVEETKENVKVITHGINGIIHYTHGYDFSVENNKFAEETINILFESLSDVIREINIKRINCDCERKFGEIKVQLDKLEEYQTEGKVDRFVEGLSRDLTSFAVKINKVLTSNAHKEMIDSKINTFGNEAISIANRRKRAIETLKIKTQDNNYNYAIELYNHIMDEITNSNQIASAGNLDEYSEQMDKIIIEANQLELFIRNNIFSQEQFSEVNRNLVKCNNVIVGSTTNVRNVMNKNQLTEHTDKINITIITSSIDEKAFSTKPLSDSEKAVLKDIKEERAKKMIAHSMIEKSLYDVDWTKYEETLQQSKAAEASLTRVNEKLWIFSGKKGKFEDFNPEGFLAVIEYM